MTPSSFRLPLSIYLGMNRLVIDWLNGDQRFVPRGPLLPEPRPEPHARGRAALAAAIVESNRAWGIDAREPVDRWQRGETVTIVAGQQVGFAGGPLYTLAKLATLLRLKRDLEREGRAVTAFFWLASEDHDFDEVATLCLPVSTIAREKTGNCQTDLICIRAAATARRRAVVGPLPVPERLISELMLLYDLPRPGWLREGIAFRDSFGELMATLFGNEIILIDALLPELRRAGASLLQSIADRSEEIQHLLAERAEELDGAGYREQVVARDGEAYTLLFTIDDAGNREPLTGKNAATPERTSTSALTRPLLQDFVLEPDIFVGGPAEVAYYAQIAPLHALLGVTMPRVALRGHVLVAPERMLQTISRYGVDPSDLFSGPEEILAEKEANEIEAIQRLTADAKSDLLARIGEIAEIALPAEHALARSFQRSVGHLEYHFGKLSERAARALMRKDRVRYQAIRKLLSELYPDGNVQDRVAAWFPYWTRYGEHLIKRLVDEVEPDSDSFKIISL